VRFLRSEDNLTILPANPERKKALLVFEKEAEIRFRRHDLLNLAFSHRSYANEDQRQTASNERLEFLGDSVLGLVVAEFLFRNYPEKPEGELAKIKSFVVSEDSLAEIAFNLGIPGCLLIGKGEENSGGRSKKALLADAFEAVVGAYYIDAGLADAQKFVLRWLVPEIEKVLANRHRRDYKTLLQEQAQKKLKTYPKYQVVERSGPDHNKVFWIEVAIAERQFGPANGHSKKEAEQKAARLAYEALFPDA
jgi:ribonuclease-3